MNKLLLTAAATAVAGLIAGPAWAGTLSSSKVAFTLGDLVGLGAEACSQAGLAAGACIGGGDGGPGVEDTGYVPVMQTFIRTPNGKELSFDVALQCALVTYTEAKGKGGSGTAVVGSSDASGRIMVRVAVTPVDNDGNVVGPTRYALPDNDGSNVLGGPDSLDAGPQGLTYCYRFQDLTLSFDNLLCLSAITNNPDDDCEIAVALLLETLEAHAFNFVLDNVASGPHRIQVQARAVADSSIFNADSSARGEAFVGMGSTRVETLRAVQAFDPDDGPLVDWVDLQ